MVPFKDTRPWAYFARAAANVLKMSNGKKYFQQNAEDQDVGIKSMKNRFYC